MQIKGQARALDIVVSWNKCTLLFWVHYVLLAVGFSFPNIFLYLKAIYVILRFCSMKTLSCNMISAKFCKS